MNVDTPSPHEPEEEPFGWEIIKPEKRTFGPVYALYRGNEVVGLYQEDADHIVHDHFSGGLKSQFAEGETLDSIVEEVAANLPDEILFNEHGESTFTLTLDRPIGTTSIVSKRQLLQEGMVTQAELDHLEYYEELAFCMSQEPLLDKKGVLAAFNEHSATVRMRLLGETIVPEYAGEPQPTNQLVVSFSREEGGPIRWRSVFPGPNMGKLEGDDTYIGARPTPAFPKGQHVAELWNKVHRGKTLTEDENALMLAQLHAHARWWRAGFMRP